MNAAPQHVAVVGAGLGGVRTAEQLRAARHDGGMHRHEHWTSTANQAAVVARALVGAPVPTATVPYFWSDQFGLKIQLLGRPDRADTVLPLLGAGLSGGAVKGTLLGYLRGDRLVAVAGFGAARHLARFRGPVLEGAARDRVLELATAGH